MCKCCDGPTKPFAKINANRTCNDGNGPVFLASSRMINYVQCRRCGFLFTGDFDRFSDAEMAEEIYNQDYVLADPDFIETRPTDLSQAFAKRLDRLRPYAKALDYGGGHGLFARLMSEKGFSFDCCDPYFGDPITSSHQYDLVTSFEVFEHSLNPQKTLGAALEFLNLDGVLLFSTALQPRPVTPNWWYIGPRNGHVSLFSERSMAVLTRAYGVHYLSLDGWLHLIFRNYNSQIMKDILDLHDINAPLYNASYRGLFAYMNTAVQLGRLGYRQAANPRHALRAITVAALRRLGLPGSKRPASTEPTSKH